MQVYALMGHIEYEGTDLLGIYADRESAVAALEAFRVSSADVFTAYYVERRELGSAARSILSDFSGELDECREWFPISK
jgi:hypothetical protein